MSEILLRDGRIPLCWDCHQTLGENAVTVRTNPRLPEWMSASVTKVCPPCAATRLGSDIAPSEPVTP